MNTAQFAQVTSLQKNGGCDFAVDPSQPAPNASAFWDPSIAPAVVSFVAPAPRMDLRTLEIDAEKLTIIREDRDMVYGRSISDVLLVIAPNCINRPIGILLPLDNHWQVRITAAQRMRAQLLRRKPVSNSLTQQQHQRISMALRTLDARRRNANYRAIAQQFYGHSHVGQEHWKTSSLKARVARLSALGRHLTERGYRSLLLGLGPTRKLKD